MFGHFLLFFYCCLFYSKFPFGVIKMQMICSRARIFELLMLARDFISIVVHCECLKTKHFLLVVFFRFLYIRCHHQTLLSIHIPSVINTVSDIYGYLFNLRKIHSLSMYVCIIDACLSKRIENIYLVIYKCETVNLFFSASTEFFIFFIFFAYIFFYSQQHVVTGIKSLPHFNKAHSFHTSRHLKAKYTSRFFI